MIAARKREAGNLPIQGSGADMMKEAMGCGFDSNGKPYLWHLLEPEYGALLENYVYDEFVTESPEANSEAVSSEVSDAIIRAAAEFVTIIPMESEGAIAKRWRK
jgi:DNA polymerase I-like protein with 3'-5' exonuclease and polymerase domains